MEFPESVLSAVKRAVKKYPSDIPAATDHAEKAIRGLPEFGGFADALVRHAIQNLIYAERHRGNGYIRADAVGPKVVVGNSPSVRRVFESYYSYSIAGTTLGQVLGADLEGIAVSEEAIADGHHFNSRLCRRLRELVPDDKCVRDAVTEKRLRAIFKEESRMYAGQAARVTG